MTLTEIQDNYAKEQDFDDWYQLLDYTFYNNGISYVIEHENKIFELVQQEQQKLIADNAKVEIKVTSNEESSIVKEYSNEDGSIKVYQSSIINENNIIR